VKLFSSFLVSELGLEDVVLLLLLVLVPVLLPPVLLPLSPVPSLFFFWLVVATTVEGAKTLAVMSDKLIATIAMIANFVFVDIRVEAIANCYNYYLVNSCLVCAVN